MNQKTETFLDGHEAIEAGLEQQRMAVCYLSERIKAIDERYRRMSQESDSRNTKADARLAEQIKEVLVRVDRAASEFNKLKKRVEALEGGK